MKTARTIAALTVALLVCTALSVSESAQAVVTAPTPVVQGNRLVDTQTNTTFVPHGVNIPGLEYSCVQGWQKLPAAAEFAAIASWKINTVRLPLNESCWLGLDNSPSGRTVAQYRADVATWVNGATAAGLVVILDLHWNAPAGYKAEGQRPMADERSSAFWTSIATTYAANKSVMFELFNEPYSRSGFTLTWDCWKNGGCQAPVENDATGTLSGAKYTVTGMQTLVNAVRTAGATQPILLGGLNYSNDLTGWLANKPTDSANQLVAAWHNYPGQGCSTACWNSTITTVAASVPIVTTEFGNTGETTSTAAGNSGNYLVPFMTWADAHGIGYMPWAWWDVGAVEANGNGSDIYALFSGASFTPKSPSGTKFFTYLASLGTAPGGTESPLPERDYSGDGFSDVFARDAGGILWLFRGNGSSGWIDATQSSSGWNGMNAIFGVDDFDGDGNPDAMARDASGNLWLFRGNGASGWLGALKIGTGWNGLNALLGAGDFSGDGFADVLARDSLGRIWLYAGNGAGGWIGGTIISSGWQGMTAIVGTGDFDGDGFADVVSRDSAGRIWLFRGNGASGWLNWGLISSGWNGMTAIASPGDFNGDGNTDLLARDTGGVMWLFPGNGSGGFLGVTAVGSGWNHLAVIP